MFVSQCHTNSCVGLLAVALSLLAVYSLKWSGDPKFFLIHGFFQFLAGCEKQINKTSVWEV